MAAPGGQLTLKDDSEAKIPKGPKIKEKNLKSDKPEPSEKAQESDKTKNKIPAFGIASNLSKTLLQKAFCRETCVRIQRKVKSRQVWPLRLQHNHHYSLEVAPDIAF